MYNASLRNIVKLSYLISLLLHGTLVVVLSLGQPGEAKRSPITVELAYVKEEKKVEEVKRERSRLRKLNPQRLKSSPLPPPIMEQPPKQEMKPVSPPSVKPLEATESNTPEDNPVVVPWVEKSYATLSSPPAVVEQPISAEGTAAVGPVYRDLAEEGGPSFRKKIIPLYPEYARRLNKEGLVLLKVLIDREGRVGEVEVIRRAGYGLDQAAKWAILKSIFYPATEKGMTVPCLVEIPVRFVLMGPS